MTPSTAYARTPDVHGRRRESTRTVPSPSALRAPMRRSLAADEYARGIEHAVRVMEREKQG